MEGFDRFQNLAPLFPNDDSTHSTDSFDFRNVPRSRFPSASPDTPLNTMSLDLALEPAALLALPSSSRPSPAFGTATQQSSDPVAQNLQSADSAHDSAAANSQVSAPAASGLAESALPFEEQVDAARRAVVLNLVAVGGALPKGYSDDCYQRLEAALANPAFSNERKLKECEAELQFLKQVAATATPMIAHDAVIGRNGSPAQHHAEPLAADALPARTAHCGHARRTHRKKIDLLPALLQPLDPNEPLIEPPPCNKPLRNKKELKDDMTYDNPSHRFTWMVNLTKQLQARVSQNQLNLLYEIVHPGKKGGTKWLGTNWVLEDVYSAAGSAWSTWPEVYIRNLQSLRPRRRCRRVKGPVSSGTTSHDEEGEPSAGTAAKQSDDMENPRLPSGFVHRLHSKSHALDCIRFD